MVTALTPAAWARAITSGSSPSNREIQVAMTVGDRVNVEIRVCHAGGPAFRLVWAYGVRRAIVNRVSRDQCGRSRVDRHSRCAHGAMSWAFSAQNPSCAGVGDSRVKDSGLVRGAAVSAVPKGTGARQSQHQQIKQA